MSYWLSAACVAQSWSRGRASRRWRRRAGGWRRLREPDVEVERPPPPGAVNSASSMPILRITHSSASTAPVAKAMSGMSPSLLLLRQARERRAATAVLVHAATWG